MVYQISSTDVRCGFEVLPENFPSIANGEMSTFMKNTIVPQVRIEKETKHINTYN